MSDTFAEIRENSSNLRYISVLHTTVKSNNKAYDRIMKVHTKKLSRTLSLEMNVDEHIQNISSYHLTFFQKLALCRGRQFALPSRIDNKEVLASFEKAYHVIEQNLSDGKKELTTATLRSIALNYIERKGPSPPKALRRAINQLKKRNDIVVTKPDKGT